MLKLLTRALGPVLLCLAVTGCAQLEAQNQTVQMQDRTRAYRKAIRWNEYEVARAFILRQDGSEYAYDEDFYKLIRVVEMEIRSREVFTDEGLSVVTAEITFYHEDYNSVHSLTDRQVWWYDAETEQWYMDGSFPDYASALGG